MGTKLHEILAVEPERERTAKKIIDEATKTFSDKPNMFIGAHKTWQMFEDAAQHQAPADEHQALATTVPDKLDWVQKNVSRYFDTNLQKECANQKAKADLIVNGVTIATDLPATFLLGMETKLNRLRPVYEAIPVLPPSMDWEDAPELGEHVRKAVHPEEKFKSAKTFQHKVLYDATPEHPAQIERWEETVNVGKSVRETWSGMLTTHEKAMLLSRLETLQQAVKSARQRANSVEVVDRKVARDLFSFIHGD